MDILYPFTVRTLFKQPDVRHGAHGRESCVCVYEVERERVLKILL